MQLSYQSIGKQLTIGELVSQDWRKAEIFKKYSIDFSCRGSGTLKEACQQEGIDLSVIEAELGCVDARVCDRANFNTWDMDILIDYIISKYHRYVAAAIPFLDALSVQVTRAHGTYHPELDKIQRLYREVSSELKVHMKREEIVLFPYIKKLVDADENMQKVPRPPFGSVANPISAMAYDHLAAVNAMKQIQELSARFTPPVDASASYRVLFAKLHEFQQCLMEHLHLENNILFPRALKLEARVLQL